MAEPTTSQHPAPTLTDNDLEGFQRAILSEAPFGRRYELLDGRLKVDFESPSKAAIDFVLAYLSERQCVGIAPALLRRLSRVLRVRCYLRRLEISERVHVFDRVSAQAARKDGVGKGGSQLVQSLDFISEELYTILEGLAYDFKRRLAALSGLFSGEGGGLTEQERWILTKRQDPKFWSKKGNIDGTAATQHSTGPDEGGDHP